MSIYAQEQTTSSMVRAIVTPEPIVWAKQIESEHNLDLVRIQRLACFRGNGNLSYLEVTEV